MTKIGKTIKDNLPGAILGAIVSGIGSGGYSVGEYFYSKYKEETMSIYFATGLSFLFSFGMLLIILGFIGWAYLELSKVADAEKARLDTEKARLDTEKARLDAEKLRIDKLEKAVSQDYDSEHWSPAEQKQNVFHVLRNDDLKTLSGETDAVNQELKTLKEVKLTEIEKKIADNFNALYNKTERQRETIEALQKKFSDDGQ